MYLSVYFSVRNNTWISTSHRQPQGDGWMGEEVVGVVAKEWVNGSLGEDETGPDPKGKPCPSTGRER